MSVQAILAVGTFIVLFAVWVVLPSRLRRKHTAKAEDEAQKEST